MKKRIFKFQPLILFSAVLLFLNFNCGFAFEGDITGNGYVGFDDLAIMAEKWLMADCDVIDCKGADINGNGTVNMVDFTLLAGNWNRYDPNLIGWWKFDDLSAELAIDATGNGNNGILHGNAKKIMSPLGGAVQLDGVADYVEIPNSPNMNFAGGLSLAAWVKVAGIKNDMMIISKGDAFAFHKDYDFNQLIFSSSGLGRPVSGSMGVFDFEWHHVAVVYDGANRSIYVDGTFDNSRAASGSVAINDQSILIGNSSVKPDTQWWGEIADVRIYNRALSQDELHDMCKQYHYAVVDMVPYDGTDYEPNDVTLSWTPGLLAHSYDLYFGTDPNEVEAANRNSDAYIGNFPADSNTYDPGILEDGMTYYWRLEHVK